jgi:hypothetical protein
MAPLNVSIFNNNFILLSILDMLRGFSQYSLRNFNNIENTKLFAKYAIIFALVILLPYIIYIIYRLTTNSKDGFLDLTRDNIIEMSDKERLAYMIFKNLETEKPEIGSIIAQGGIELANDRIPIDTYIERTYGVLNAQKPVFERIVNKISENGAMSKMDFDDFFITMHNNVLKILNSKNMLSKTNADKYRAAIDKRSNASSIVPTTKVVAIEDVLKTLGAKAAPLPDATKSEPAPTKGSKELEKLAKDVAGPVTGPSAKASEVAAIRVSSPGLSQGRGYLADCPMVKPAKPAPAYPRIQNPTCDCQSDTPIMNDGRPFDPNEYIRKDSIPCWNCSIPR